MPSVSKAQARFVRAKAAEGEGWAKEWAAAEGPTNLLPERVGHPDEPDENQPAAAIRR